MRNDTFDFFRATILIVLLMLMIAFCLIEADSTGRPQPEEAEPATMLEPTQTTPETEPTTRETEPVLLTCIAPQKDTIVAEPINDFEQPEVTEPPYDPEELEMLAIVIYREAGGDACSDETRLMVGTVVMNRIADPRYPDTMEEVLTQESQYGRMHWTGIVWPERAAYDCEAHAVERAYAIAERILLGERALPGDVIYQAEFPQGSEVVAYQDGTYFCR